MEIKSDNLYASQCKKFSTNKPFYFIKITFYEEQKSYILVIVVPTKL